MRGHGSILIVHVGGDSTARVLRFFTFIIIDQVCLCLQLDVDVDPPSLDVPVPRPDGEGGGDVLISLFMKELLITLGSGHQRLTAVWLELQDPGDQPDGLLHVEHLPSHPSQVEQQMDPQLIKDRLVSRLTGNSLGCVLIPHGGLLQLVLPEQRVAVLQQLVEESQHHHGPVLRQAPGSGAQLGTFL